MLRLSRHVSFVSRASSALAPRVASLHVCVVGSGPSGFYSAKYLLRDAPDVRVDVIDALPNPFGLVRTGVAPDHPEVKQVTNDFDVVATDPRFGFLGNVHVGRDVSVSQLFSVYDAVILAYGAASERGLGVPGERLDNVTSARAFVNWYNGHPDFADFAPNLDTEDVVIVGQGNVAIDCARILAKTVAELRETDIAAHALEALSRSKVKRVHVVGRRGHLQAAVTMKELREVTRLDDADFVVHGEELERGRGASSLAELEAQRPRKRMEALFTEQAAAAAARSTSGGGKGKQLIMRFLLNPKACVSSAKSTKVASVDFDVTALEGPPDAQRAVPTGKVETIPAGLVLSSIGYKALPIPGVPFDDKKNVIPNANGRVLAEAGAVDRPVGGLYTVGWVKRGPSGIIGTNITCARETTASLLEDKAKGRLGGIPSALMARKDGLRGMEGLKSLLKGTTRRDPGAFVDWADWRRLDALELARGAAAGKAREKLVKVPDFIAALQPGGAAARA